jgi:UDP-N-acetylglucosamine 2-epimerase (non-hydrolysing)
MIEQAAERYHLVFVLHPSTRKKLVRFGLLARIQANSKISVMPRTGYTEFVRMLRLARFVITDGGGNQEELSYLGVPTLLMRKATERQEGMGSTAILCNYDSEILHRFLAQLPGKAKLPEPTVPSPTRIIVDRLMPYA